ncbi:MAG: hypothetical protein C4K48_08580 [Candidatus Thorarchaeota archaeon]|nr:MAG: hypothetical protein C4K48_08580 [Candidatus Thorarchaeota archaeon]
MTILDRLFDMFGRRRALRMGAVSPPTDLVAYLYRVRAATYFKITGKTLPNQSLPAENGVEDMTRDLSPSRRLARRGL